MSATAVSNKYLQRRLLPHFSSSCGSVLGNNWGLVSEGTNLADLTGFYSLTKSCGSSR